MRNDGRRTYNQIFRGCCRQYRQLREEFEGYLKSMMDSDDDFFPVVRVKEVLDVYKKLEEK